MPVSPIGSTHGGTTLSVACHHHPWAAHIIRSRRVWHATIALGKHTWLDGVGRGILSSPLENIHDQTTSGVAWLYHRAWHSFISFGHHIQWDDIGRNMPSVHFDCTCGRTTSVLACRHVPWVAHTFVGCRMWHANITLGQHT